MYYIKPLPIVILLYLNKKKKFQKKVLNVFFVLFFIGI